MAEPCRLTIDDLAFDGKAVAHLGGKVVFLDAGLPGETVLAQITRSKQKYDQGRVIEILDRSSSRIKPLCEHFEHCGGCSWQDLKYDDQLVFKQRHVTECITRIGKLEDPQVLEVLPASDIFGYRNKMEFSFHFLEEEDSRLGLHRRGRFDDIFDVKTCHLQSPLASKIVCAVREFVHREQVPVYDVKLHIGYLRFLVIRETRFTGQLMINLVTNMGEFPKLGEFVGMLTSEFPEITTILHGQSGKKANVALAEVETVLYGPGFIEEEVGGRRFKIRANSFFQTNSAQAELLYQTAFDLLSPEATHRVLDLYCGTGAIGLLLADRVDEVVGVELVPDAVAMARENAAANGIDNVSFYEGHVRDFLKELDPDLPGYDTIIIDPPRAGLHPKALKKLLTLGAPQVLYISCNPATFARDARALVDSGYGMSPVHPVDMFPHTRHIELVALFSK